MPQWTKRGRIGVALGAVALTMAVATAVAIVAFSADGGGEGGQAVPLPPGDAEARSRLDVSPRHAEWAEIPVEDGEAIRAWVVYPERPDPTPVVIVIHEIFGLTDWIRGVADQLAADGFLAVAPDLLSGKGPEGGGTEAFDRDGVVQAVRGLDPAEVDRRLDAAARYATALPAARPAFAVIGFCWGGATSFRYATVRGDLGAAVVYYGSSPEAAALATVEAPVLGLYAGDDARVNQTIAPAQERMVELGKRFDHEIYEGAGHGFLRAQEGRDGANLRASERAWPRTLEFLRETIGG